MQLPDASVGPEQVAPIDAVAKVVDRSAKGVDHSAQHSVLLGEVHPETARLAVAKVCQVVGQVAERMA